MGVVKVKICGITSVADAQHAAACGADAIGLVFYEHSSRYIADLGLAREICQTLAPFVVPVGLFVNADSKFIDSVLSQVPLGMLQFHGDETEAQCHLYCRPFIKALRMKPDVDVKQLCDLFGSAQGILLDAYQPGIPGGTGEVFDWRRIPSDVAKPLVLAGGLTPHNVKQAVERVRPWAVDVSGGVEAAPGKKDGKLVCDFVAQAKSVDVAPS